MAYPLLQRQSPGFISVPYGIYSGRGEGSTGIDAAIGHGPQGNQATLILQAHLDDLNQALLDLLGFYEVQRVFPARLNRTVPPRHPLYGSLRCSRITGVKPVRLLGKATPLDPVNMPGASVFPVHDHYLITCLFTQPKWPMYTDGDLDRIYPPVVASDGNAYRQEWRRWTCWTETATVESVTREAGSLKWAEGGGTGPTIGNDFNSPWPRFLQKQELVCRWAQVPAFRGLLSSAAATPERPLNLEAGLYTVNDATFRGYPAGTLLFKGWALTWNEAPYGSDDFAGRTPSLTVDVELYFLYFDPPPGGATRGHNLAPFSPPAGGDGLWYKVVEKNTSTPLFASSPFERLFALPG
jgi:hypothetical protein